MFETDGLILNRVDPTLDIARLDLEGLNLLSAICDDHKMRDADIEGASIFTLDESTPFVTGVKSALARLGILMEEAS